MGIVARHRVIASILLLPVIVGVASCTDGGAGASTSVTASASPGAGAARPIDAPSCLPAVRAVTVGPAADPTIVVTAGTGERGIVLAPQMGASFCQWAAQIARYSDAGYRVASFSWAKDGIASITSAVDVLRGDGATDVVLIGASKGGAYSAAVADELAVPPVGVIALSPPATFETVDATSVNSTYTGPLLVVASVTDGSVPASESAKVARSADPSTYVELPGGAHGVALLLTSAGPALNQRMDEFVAAAFAS